MPSLCMGSNESLCERSRLVLSSDLLGSGLLPQLTSLTVTRFLLSQDPAGPASCSVLRIGSVGETVAGLGEL